MGTGHDKMVSEHIRKVQEAFLEYVIKERAQVTIYLVNGIKLHGTVQRVDNYCVLLTRDNHSQLVFKHSISTVMPELPVRLLSDG